MKFVLSHPTSRHNIRLSPPAAPTRSSVVPSCSTSWSSEFWSSFVNTQFLAASAACASILWGCYTDRSFSWQLSAPSGRQLAPSRRNLLPGRRPLSDWPCPERQTMVHRLQMRHTHNAHCANGHNCSWGKVRHVVYLFVVFYWSLKWSQACHWMDWSIAIWLEPNYGSSLQSNQSNTLNIIK